MGAVASQTGQYGTVAELAGAIAFHAVTSVVGSQLIVLGSRQVAADAPAS